MRLAAAINGSLTAEHAAQMALLYARGLKLPLDVLAVSGAQDTPQAIEKSHRQLAVLAEQLEVPLRFILQKGTKPAPILASMIREENYHTLFCSTRAQKKRRFFSDSVSQALSRARISTHVAIVSVCKVNHVHTFNRIGFFGDKNCPDLNQLSLALALAKARQAELVLGNPLRLNRQSLRKQGFHELRELLKASDQGFHPLVDLCHLSGVPATIAHLPAGQEGLDYLLSRKIDLLVLNAKNLPAVPKPMLDDPVEHVFHHIPLNCIVLFVKA